MTHLVRKGIVQRTLGYTPPRASNCVTDTVSFEWYYIFIIEGALYVTVIAMTGFYAQPREIFDSRF